MRFGLLGWEFFFVGKMGYDSHFIVKKANAGRTDTHGELGLANFQDHLRINEGFGGRHAAQNFQSGSYLAVWSPENGLSVWVKLCHFEVIP